MQRYVKKPLLIDGKKFDLRLYVLITGFSPIKAYLANEGLARLCTHNYKSPAAGNLKNLFAHLTNYSLNKESDKYKQPGEDFMTSQDGSKRLLTATWQALEEAGSDITAIQE